jgi:hypothetical protein
LLRVADLGVVGKRSPAAGCLFGNSSLVDLVLLDQSTKRATIFAGFLRRVGYVAAMITQ